MQREIIVIDEEKCDGCGQCVPACHEGALEVVKGKVKLVAEKLCDGLGDCLGECPQGALQVVKQEADDYDEVAVEARIMEIQAKQAQAARVSPAALTQIETTAGQSCPSKRFVQLGQTTAAAGAAEDIPTELTHWPVQLRLLPPTAPVFKDASLLLAADCVPVAFPNFHQKLLRGKSVAVACPKLDDARAHLEKLTEIIRLNDLKEITVAHMEVPCCSGLLMMTLEARRMSGKSVPILDMTIGTQGEVLTQKEVPEEAPAQIPV
jgi:Fe-S-cluster-containing hydrogenase component 2